MVELAILILSSIVNILLGTIVYLKNPSSATNKLFFILTGSFAAWSIVNYISVHPILLPQLWWIRFVLFFATFLCLCVFLTFDVFPHYKMPPSKWIRNLAVIASTIVMALTLTPLIFKNIEIHDGHAQPVPNIAIPLFAITVFSLLAGGVLILIKKYRKSHGNEKLQLRFVLLGLAGTFSLIFITDFVFVVLFNNTKLVPLGPAYTLIFSTSLAYAIVRHKLFDIRAAAARALTYILSLSFIGITYGILVFIGTTILSSSDKLDSSQRIIYIALALFTALLYPKIKSFFDRVTNKIFFKDSYDPQSFIDHLNDILVSTIELDELLNKVSRLVSLTIKASYVDFVITSNNAKEQTRVIGENTNKYNEKEVNEFVEILKHSHKKVIITDELLDHGQIRLHSIFNELGVAMVIMLSTHKQHIGYLIIGYRQSGEAFRDSDISVLDIIADEVSLGIQNALRFEEIQNFAATLQQKVDEATRQLRHANDRLRALDETKDEFISMASHQLRTPLTTVKGYVSMVLEGDAGKVSEPQRKLLDQSFLSAQRMVYLIADLLNVSRLRTGKFVIDAVPTNLADLVEGEIEQLKETAKSRNLTLTYNKPKNFPVLMLDDTKIRQVVMNFADNAIYYTPAGGHININLVDLGDNIEFSVVDDGIGVPKTVQHHLFGKFYRADNAKKARPDGTGLGLFMAKKVVVAQGGVIVFKSVEGKGSTFGFNFNKDKLKVPSNLKSNSKAKDELIKSSAHGEPAEATNLL